MNPGEKMSQFYERTKIATQIVKARKSERESKENTYKFHRSGKEYFYRIGGLENLFKYLKSLPSNKVLDVGAGTGNASYKISQMPISKGLDFEITALRNSPELKSNFPEKKTHITGAESLRGIENKSLAGVIGVNSIAYSLYPKLVAGRIDEVLVDGGVVKATFALFGESHNYDGSVFNGPEKFIEAFAILGYDIFFIENKFFDNDRYDFSRFLNSIVLAIKPGNQNAPSAKELLDLDFDAINNESLDKGRDCPVFDIKD
jgi:SAM-dependent methyltransferase